MNSSNAKSNIGLLSHDAGYMEYDTTGRSEPHVKVATLFYDELIWPTYDSSLLATIESLRLSGDQQTQLRSYWKALDALPAIPEGRDLLGLFLRSSKAHHSDAAERMVYNAIKEQFMVENSWNEAQWNEARKDHHFARDHAAAGMFVWGMADVWKATRERIGCRLAAFSAPELLAAMADSFSAEADSIPRMEQAISLHVPSFGRLTWDEVLGLRSEPGLMAFRTWLSSMGSQQTGPDLGQRAVDDLWSALDRVMPNLKAELIKAVVCELPGVGQMASIRDILASRRFSHEFGWLIFLHQMRDAKSASPQPEK